jgi:hypothetical protein
MASGEASRSSRALGMTRVNDGAVLFTIEYAIALTRTRDRAHG